MSKTRFQKVADVCRRIYEKSGMSAVCDLVNMKLEANNPEFEGVSYKPCRACDNDVPSMNGICLICGQPTAKVKYNIWVEIERVEEYDDDEVYRDEDNPLKIGIRDTLEDAVELQNEVVNAYGEMSFPVPSFSQDFIEKIQNEKRQAMAENEDENTAEKLENFLESHTEEIKGLYRDKYYRNGGWNGMMDAMNDVMERYNFEYDIDDLADGLFENIVNSHLF